MASESVGSKRNCNDIISESESQETAPSQVPVAKKRRGRPPGSKNKPKPAAGLSESMIDNDPNVEGMLFPLSWSSTAVIQIEAGDQQQHKVGIFFRNP